MGNTEEVEINRVKVKTNLPPGIRCIQSCGSDDSEKRERRFVECAFDFTKVKVACDRTQMNVTLQKHNGF